MRFYHPGPLKDVQNATDGIQCQPRRIGSPNSKMTQTSSAIIVAIKPWMEYAKLCMGMRLGNARYSA